MKSAATSPRQIAERRVAALLRQSQIAEPDTLAAELVAQVLAVLSDPDRFMQEAGRRELALAVPHPAGKVYVRNLAAATWRTMIHQAKA